MISEATQGIDSIPNSLEALRPNLSFLRPLVSKLKDVGQYLNLYLRFLNASTGEEELQICREYNQQKADRMIRENMNHLYPR
jgi:hypothetical protein